jgi:hypothetical protein
VFSSRLRFFAVNHYLTSFGFLGVLASWRLIQFHSGSV